VNPRLRPAVFGAVLTGLLCTTLSGAPVGAAAKTKHDLTVAAEEIGGDGTNEFRILGTVSTFKGRNLTIQIRINKGGWDPWKKTATDPDDGSFSERVYGGRRGSKVCYKVVVPSTKRFKTTKRKAGCIRTAA
jgi:hypothetical protein